MADLNQYIEKQINRLQSSNANTRYDACEMLKVAPTTTPLAIKALQNALMDSDSEVVDAANRALKVHLPSEIVQKEDQKSRLQQPLTGEINLDYQYKGNVPEEKKWLYLMIKEQNEHLLTIKNWVTYFGILSVLGILIWVIIWLSALVSFTTR